MLLTQLESGAVCRFPAIQRTSEHITSLLLPCVFKGSTNQQPENTKRMKKERGNQDILGHVNGLVNT